MVFSEYTKLRILYLWSLRYKPPAIAAILEDQEGIYVSSRGVAKFIQRYLQTGKLQFVAISFNNVCVYRNHCKAAREWQEDTHHSSNQGHRRGTDEKRR